METYKTVKLPHIRHTIEFYDMKYLQGVEIKGSGFTAVKDVDTTMVFFEDIEKTVQDVKLAPWVSHELVHVLQIITEKLSASFESEQEHMAYIMHYMYEELIK